MTNESQTIDNDHENLADTGQEILQIRRLLFGEFEKQYSQRLDRLEYRQQQFEAETLKKFQDIIARLDQLSFDTDQKQKASIKQLGDSIAKLGEHIAGMGDITEQAAIDDIQPE